MISMKKYIETYMKEIESFIASDLEKADSTKLKEVLSELETKILYFQHERLIHLIVTVLFALLEISAIYVMLISVNIIALILSALFLVLLVPYVMHYYFLENSVQKFYKLRDTIKSKC